MKLRRINPRKEKWKYYHLFSPAQVFEKVYVCLIDNTLWYNGRDGYFYNHIKTSKCDSDCLVNGHQHIVTQSRTLAFVTDNMRTGFNMAGDPVCHRKNIYGKMRQPLRGASIVPKK